MSVYGLWFAQFVFGPPDAIYATGSLTPRGVDDQYVAALAYDQPQHATVSASMRVTNSGYASVHGTHGSVEFLDYFVFPARMKVTIKGTTSISMQDVSTKNRPSHRRQGRLSVVGARGLPPPARRAITKQRCGRSVAEIRANHRRSLGRVGITGVELVACLFAAVRAAASRALTGPVTQAGWVVASLAWIVARMFRIS